MLADEPHTNSASEPATPVIRRRHRPGRRGGNRLLPHQYCTPPTYEHRKDFEPETRPRGGRYKAKYLFMLDVLVDRGVLPWGVADVLRFLAKRVNSNTLLVTCDHPYKPGEKLEYSGFWGTRYIREARSDRQFSLPPQGDEPADSDSEDPKRRGRLPYDRTGGRRMKIAFDLGIVDKIHHTYRGDDGKPRQTSNYWRLQIPPHLEDEIDEMWKLTNRRTKRAGSKPEQPATPRTPAGKARELERRIKAYPCPTCAGTGQERNSLGGYEPCETCDGVRTLHTGGLDDP